VTLKEISALIKPIDVKLISISVHPEIVSNPGARGEDSPLAVLA
jgi:hypothetical protein